MKNRLLLFFVLLSIAAGWSQTVEDTPGLPRVLLIGDSISMGYTAPTRELLMGRANVHRVPGNAGHTGMGLANLDQWLAPENGKWDVIHFNWGLWDLCYRHPESKTGGKRDKVNGTITHTPEQYAENLRLIVKRLRKTGAKLIWASTTPVPAGEVGRKLGDDMIYNRVAAEVMAENGIPINDLHALMTPHMKTLTSGPGNVHFTEAGSRILAAEVARVVGAALPAPGPVSRAQTGLNFVVILVDDMGWTDLSCQGSKYYQTPNVDRLAAEGMRFTDAYAACAVCSPTRAAVLTGRYPARTGVTDWIRAKFQRGGLGTPESNPVEYVGGKGRRLLCPPNPYWLEHEEVTLAEALKPAGYVSCHIGKWHLGDEDWYPLRQGFDFNLGGCDYGQPPSYFDPYTNKNLPQGIPGLAPRRAGEYLTDREADEAVQFIEKHKERPFFLYLAHYAVHTPIQAKEDVTEKYRQRPVTRQKNAKYAAMVESVDDSTGRVLRALKEAGVEDRTVVLFTSDNGGLLGPTDNAPLRSGKGYAYEGGIRVPLIIRWPGVVEAGTLSSQPVTSVDYFPTLLELAGVKRPNDREIDGVSLVNHLKTGAKEALEREAIFWHFPHYRHDPGPYSIVRRGDWKLIKFYEGPTFELFNLKDDLGEKTNLASKLPERVASLDRELMGHLKAVGAKLPRENPDYAPR